MKTNTVTQVLEVKSDPKRSIATNFSYILELSDEYPAPGEEFKEGVNNLETPMNLNVKLILISEMKHWLMFIMEETGISDLFNQGNM